MVRLALECLLALRGYVSLHAAAVEVGQEAYAFSGPSGVGKSTRAGAWLRAFDDAALISGDRPLISVSDLTLYGVPWDGKEGIHRNIHAPLKGLCMIRRGDFTRVRRLSPVQARRELMRQCFIPMWDTDAAAEAMMLIGCLARRTPVYRVICGPGEEDARALHEILYHRPDEIREIEEEMKIKNGFVLRNLLEEYVVMPTGQNITAFGGTIVLNEVAAFVWSKMAEPVTRNELVEYILSEYEIDRATAERDLDALIDRLNSYGVLEDC
jgi:hypothetical protein